MGNPFYKTNEHIGSLGYRMRTLKEKQDKIDMMLDGIAHEKASYAAACREKTSFSSPILRIKTTHPFPAETSYEKRQTAIML